MTTVKDPCICGGGETSGHVVECPADLFDAPAHPWMTDEERARASELDANEQ